MKLSGPQERLLTAIALYSRGEEPEPMWVSANELRTARSLEKRGLVKITTAAGNPREHLVERV